METYKVKTVDKPLSGTVVVPGSKSMTNRALLLAALSEEEAILQGVLFSDDSRHFLDCLVTLGYKLDINETEKTVKLQGCGRKIPNKFAKINVGSAGTAARFSQLCWHCQMESMKSVVRSKWKSVRWKNYLRCLRIWGRNLPI